VVKSFVLGAITGGTIVWFWGREIRQFVDSQTAGIREATAGKLQAAADGLQTVAGGFQAAKNTIETGLGGA
jgi:hypothetical protein